MLVEKRSSALTVETYRHDLNMFQEYMEQDPNPETRTLESATARHIRRFVMGLLNDGMKETSVNRKIAALKSFYKYMLRNGKITKNPADLVESVKTPKQLPVFVREQEMDELLDVMEYPEGYIGVRDRTMMELFYLTGVRNAELCGLTNASIDFGLHCIKVLGKRNKERIVPINEGLETSLRNYISERNATFEGSEEKNSSFFLNKKGNPLTIKNVYSIVHGYLEKVTTARRKSPHVLRHSFATALLNNGGDITAIKDLLGHTSLAATQVYTHTEINKLCNIYNRAHPWANKEDKDYED